MVEQLFCSVCSMVVQCWISWSSAYSLSGCEAVNIFWHLNAIYNTWPHSTVIHCLLGMWSQNVFELSCWNCWLVPLTFGGAKLLGTHISLCVCMAVCLFVWTFVCLHLFACFLFCCCLNVSMFGRYILRARSMERHFERKRYALLAPCWNACVLQGVWTTSSERHNLRDTYWQRCIWREIHLERYILGDIHLEMTAYVQRDTPWDASRKICICKYIMFPHIFCSSQTSPSVANTCSWLSRVSSRLRWTLWGSMSSRTW